MREKACFDIDIIYIWVDGSDPEFIKTKARYGGECKLPWANGASRFADCDELRYSLRSIHEFAPWLRKIHIVTNGQRPAWLDISHSKINFVTHEQIFLKKIHLPTFSSLAIECHLHRIPGLSEHFVMANDDTFIGAPVLPSTFFDSIGRMRVSLNRRLLPAADVSSTMQIHARNAANLLRQLFGDRPRCFPRHQMKPFTKSLFHIFDLKFRNLMDSMSSHRFRHPDDIHLAYVFASHYALEAGLGIRSTRPGYNMRVAKDTGRNRVMFRKLLASRPQFFCINNSTISQRKIVRNGLNRYFPRPSPFEIGSNA